MSASSRPLFVFVVNPTSGGGRGERAGVVLHQCLSRRNVRFRVVSSVGAEASESAAWHAAEEADAVVAVGGDGTIHRVGKGLLRRGLPTPLGVIPAGTGNDFARSLGMSSDAERALEQLMHARVREADHGVIAWEDDAGASSSVFMNVAGVGFDAAVAERVSRQRWSSGLIGYALAALRLLPGWRSSRVQIEDDEGSLAFKDHLFLMSVGNGATAGGGFRLTPNASVFDGALDACIVRELSPVRALALLPAAIVGRHTRSALVRMTRSVGLTLESNASLPLHADGEVMSTSARRVRFSVVTGGLRVLAPE